MDRILEDIRVADLSHVWFGPWCTRILAMLGADVVKVEPTWGEFIRYNPPVFQDAGPNFICLNTDKRGVSLNMKDPRGKEAFLKLVEKSDVVIENFMPGTMEKLGIAYDTLSRANPRIIYATLSGFGETGPYSRRPSFAPIAESYSSFTRLNGDDVDPNGPPVGTTDAFGDLVPGTWAALSVIAALRYRDKTGIGQAIDVSQIEVCTHMVTNSFTTHLLTGEPAWQVWRRYYAGVGGIIKAADGYVRIAAAPGAMTDRLGSILGIQNPTQEQLVSWVASKKRDEVVELISKGDIPIAPVNSIDEVLVDPHMKARNAFTEIDEPRSPTGRLVISDFPVKFSKTPGKLRRRAPKLGEHNEEVLIGLLGYTKEQVDQMRKDRVIT